MHSPCEGILRLSVREADAWGDLRPTWERIHASSEAPTFFLSVTWIDAWLSVFGPGVKSNFVCLEADGETIGMALLCRRQFRRGAMRIRQLYLNTAGEGKDSPLLEHNVLICAPRYRKVFATTLMDLLRNQRWDELVLSGIRSTDHPWFDESGQAAMSAVWREAPYVDLSRIRAAGTPYLELLSRNTRHQIRRSLNLYEQRGDVVLESADSPAHARELFAELIDLHQAAWQGRGKAGAFAAPRLRRFHEQVVEAGLSRGEVQLLRARAGNQTIGVLYNLCSHGHVGYYQSGLRYEGDQRLKPGLVCHALAIQHAVGAGFSEYDFLAAANDGARYKRSLSSDSRQLGWITLKQETFRNRVADATQMLRRRLTMLKR